MIVNVHSIEFNDDSTDYKIVDNGYIDSDYCDTHGFSPNYLRYLCNDEENITNKENFAIRRTGTGFIFENPIDKLFYMYLPRGWKRYKKISDFEDDLKNHIDDKYGKASLLLAYFSIDEGLWGVDDNMKFINKDNYKELNVGDLVNIIPINKEYEKFERTNIQVSHISNKINGDIIVEFSNGFKFPNDIENGDILVSHDPDKKKAYEIGEPEIIHNEELISALLARDSIYNTENDELIEGYREWYIGLCNHIRKKYNIKNYISVSPISKNKAEISVYDLETDGDTILTAYRDVKTRKWFIVYRESEMINKEDYKA